MKLKNVFIIGIFPALLAACNNNGAGSNSTDSSTVTQENSTGTSNTTTKTTVQVPAKTQSSFQAKYPQAVNVTWTHYDANPPIEWQWIGWPTLDDSDYVATFDMDNSNYWVWYDDQGDWVGTVADVNPTGLPSAVNNTIQSQFAGYTVVSAKKENDKNRTAYEVKMENGGNKMKALIAENGSVIKKKGEVDGTKVKEKPLKDSTK